MLNTTFGRKAFQMFFLCKMCVCANATKGFFPRETFQFVNFVSQLWVHFSWGGPLPIVFSAVRRCFSIACPRLRRACETARSVRCQHVQLQRTVQNYHDKLPVFLKFFSMHGFVVRFQPPKPYPIYIRYRSSSGHILNHVQKSME